MAHTLFPFRDKTLNAMHRSLVEFIQGPNYPFRLPDLNNASWQTICSNEEERERLEFVGDALVAAFLAEELHRCIPNGNPGFYTCARNVLAANCTFAQLMSKAGCHDLTGPIKPAGDAFETILAQHKLERGLAALQGYLQLWFNPLIHCVARAYDQVRQTTRAGRQQANIHMHKNILTSSHIRDVNRLLKKNKKKKAKARAPFASGCPIPAPRTAAAADESHQLPKKFTYIDLTTVDSDDDNSELEVEKSLIVTGQLMKPTASSSTIHTQNAAIPIQPDTRSPHQHYGSVRSGESGKVPRPISNPPHVLSRKNINVPLPLLPYQPSGSSAIWIPGSSQKTPTSGFSSRYKNTFACGAGSAESPIVID